MIEIIGIFREEVIKKTFKCSLDAGEFRDFLDAQYPIKVIWRKI
jgi:hypothetical protein